MTVRFVGEPNYQLIEEGLRRMLMAMTPEERRKYAHKDGETIQKDDQEPVKTEKRP